MLPLRTWTLIGGRCVERRERAGARRASLACVVVGRAAPRPVCVGYHMATNVSLMDDGVFECAAPKLPEGSNFERASLAG